MYICYLCTDVLETCNLLIDHFRIIHYLDTVDFYKCLQENCNQTFSNIKAFKKHLTNNHRTNFNTENSQNHVKFKNNNENNNDNMFHCASNDISSTDANFRHTSLNIYENPIPVNNFPQSVANELDILKEKTINFTSDLLYLNNLSRKETFAIICKVSKLISNVVDIIEEAVFQTDKVCEIVKLNDLLESSKNLFGDIKSEFLFVKLMTEKNLYCKPVAYTINSEISNVIKSGNPSLGIKEMKAYFIPLKFQFKKIFEIPGLLDEFLSHMDNLQNTSKSGYENFINGSLYKQKIDKIGRDKIIIPYFLYTDDFQVNNPLGSYTTDDMLCGIYYSFPTLPPHLLSSLKFIFVAGFIKSKYIKHCGNSSSFFPLVEEIIYLEKNGIEIFTSGMPKNIYFILGCILGDNLGLKAVLGFNKSFNCQKYCRTCNRGKEQLKYDTVEINASLRTRNSYDRDIRENNTKLTGIEEESIFNTVPSFHVTDNYCFDLMHDLFEGICHYEISYMLLDFMKNNILTLQMLNSRKKSFQYGETEIGNVSSNIEIRHLNNSKLKMSARETWHFTHFLPLLVGDLVPKNNKMWKMFLLLLEVIDLLLLRHFTDSDLQKLEKTIKEHHALYIKLVGSLKPKHHFMVHYSSAIKKCGPLKYLWSFKFESKHKEIKNYAKVISSRKNIAHSVIVKYSFAFTNLLVNYNKVKESLIYVNDKIMDLSSCIDCTNFPKISGINYNEVWTLKDIVHNGYDYKKGYYLTHLTNDALQLYKIMYLILSNDKDIFVIAKEINILGFDKHLLSYKVGSSKNSYNLYNIDYFSSSPIHIYNIPSGESFIRNKSL